jgi:hypothetical protein
VKQNRGEAQTRRRARQVEVLVMLHAMTPREVYGGLFGYTQSRGSPKAAGWTSHMFKEIYGTWPRKQDRGPPTEPPGVILEWISMRPKKSKR